MKVKTVLILAFLICAVFKGSEGMALTVKSSAFNDGDMMDVKYTCKGEDVSPQLSWDGVPNGTKSFALICDDPDAPIMTWVHWVIYDIPANVTELSEGIAKEEVLSSGTKQGKNDFRKIGYGGPCPPPGGPHRYFFKLYALDAELNLEPGLSKKALLKAMEGHILEEAQVLGKFKR